MRGGYRNNPVRRIMHGFVGQSAARCAAVAFAALLYCALPPLFFLLHETQSAPIDIFAEQNAPVFIHNAQADKIINAAIDA